jgi:hypothetical protein
MRRHFFYIFIFLYFTFSSIAQETLFLKVCDESTTFPAVETVILENGNIYWDEKALGAIFGASLKTEGENLVILCREDAVLPFYRDDPKNPVLDRKGISWLPAKSSAEFFGYPRLELDRKAGAVKLLRTPEPEPDKPELVRLPDFSLRDSSGKMVELKGLQGKKQVILVWAPWDKSRDFLPVWNRLASDFGESVRFIIVAETIEKRERIEPFLSMLKPRPLCLVDSGFHFSLLFRLKELPSILLIDEKGSLVWGPRKVNPANETFREILVNWCNGKPGDSFILKVPSMDNILSPAIVEESVRRFELAKALWESGKKEEAIDEFSQGFKKFPDKELFEKQLFALKNSDKVYPSPTPTPSPVPAKKDQPGKQD